MFVSSIASSSVVSEVVIDFFPAQGPFDTERPCCKGKWGNGCFCLPNLLFGCCLPAPAQKLNERGDQARVLFRQVMHIDVVHGSSMPFRTVVPQYCSHMSIVLSNAKYFNVLQIHVLQIHCSVHGKMTRPRERGPDGMYSHASAIFIFFLPP